MEPMGLGEDDKMELTWKWNTAWTNDDNIPWTEYDQIYPMNLKSKKKKKSSTSQLKEEGRI